MLVWNALFSPLLTEKPTSRKCVRSTDNSTIFTLITISRMYLKYWFSFGNWKVKNYKMTFCFSPSDNQWFVEEIEKRINVTNIYFNLLDKKISNIDLNTISHSYGLFFYNITALWTSPYTYYIFLNCRMRIIKPFPKNK